MGNTDTTLKAALEQAADAIVLTELSGVIQYVNAAFERVSGYARGEVLGRHVRLLKSGQDEAAFYRTLWMTLCQGQVWSGIFVNRRKDGRLYEDQTVISPVRNDGGSVVGYLAVKRDVTVERQNELQRRQAQKLDAIGRLAGGVAHDFNNALMTVMGHAEMLEHNRSSRERTRWKSAYRTAGAAPDRWKQRAMSRSKAGVRIEVHAVVTDKTDIAFSHAKEI